MVDVAACPAFGYRAPTMPSPATPVPEQASDVCAVLRGFRDVAPIVGSIMQIAFSVTSIDWKPELTDGTVGGGAPNGDVRLVAAGWSALPCGTSRLPFARVRGRLAVRV